MYDRIQKLSCEMLPETVRNRLRESKEARFELILELLQTQHLQMCLLSQDLKRIHRYYACVVNSAPLSVSADMCDLAGKVLCFMENYNKQIQQKQLKGQ